MAFNNSFTAVTGATYTAAQYNTHTRDNFSAIWAYTTAGDIVYATSSTALARLGIGTAGYILGSSGSAPLWVDGTRYISMPLNGDVALTTGDGQAYFDIGPGLAGYNITFVGLIRASGTGVPLVQLARIRSGAAVDVLSTRVSIDSGETSSSTAAAAPVINASNDDLASRDILRADVDTSGTSTLYCVLTVGVKLP